MADEFKAARPVEYYRKFLEKDVRPDGRELGEGRQTILNIGCVSTAEGSALVKMGNTSVICGVKAELCNPKSDEPNRGYVVPNVELSPLCSPRFRPGPPGEQAQVLSQFMVDVIQHSQMLKLEDLCVTPGKLVWVLYCDIVCLDYDGNVTDACVLALLSAIKNTKLPSVSVNEETEAIETDEDLKQSLSVLSLPVSTTFAIFDDNILIMDPTVEEEDLATGTVTVVTVKDKLCIIHKPGGTPLSDAQLQDCIARSFIRGKVVEQLIEDTLLSVDR